MPLKIYGPVQAGGSLGAVLMVLAEKQVPFELVPIDMGKYEHKTPAYRALQPFAQTPVMDEDGFILFESRAICRYLAEKYADRGTALIPTEPKAKARFEQGASIEFANFHPYAVPIIMEGLGKPLKGGATDKRVYDAAVAGLKERLAAYEVVLGTQRFIGGDEFTLADVFHVGHGAFLAHAGCDLMTSSGPNVARWFGEITARPSWTRWVRDGDAVRSTAAYDSE
ncbi:glutathione S-transferase [Mycena belliarum]|uniref:glutathione transferase n=1 Tax=Mycena belliarum TaxID=1033014 RepID=A0AAD6TP55_9AGAR|nr:glutathione S-transferase [Mycena belliae]